MILKYSEYLTEKIIYNMLLESKVVFSEKFINVLNKIQGNKIADNLLNISSKDYNVQHNYIDITDQKDAVSFIPDRKAVELTKDLVETYEVINESKYLTHGERNNGIFERLGYDKVKAGTVWIPDEGTIGIKKGETKTSSGKTYILFEEYNVENPRSVVLNIEAVQPTSNFDILWTTSRNNIKIGRLVRAILSASNITVTDKDIEEFVNQYKATYDFLQDKLNQFDVVSGDLISHWYEIGNYKSGHGSLNNSCMAEVDSEYFDIYTKNPQISLVILYADGGSISNAKYTSSLIKGRAILWKAENAETNEEIIFMDRIYTVQDSDVELFKQYANSKGWYYKQHQDMDSYCNITNGTTKSYLALVVPLDNVDFDYYPYMDTMFYINMENNTASNRKEINGIESDRALRSTEGEWYEADSY